MIMKRLFLTLALGAMAVFGLNSCSDDDSEGGGEKRPYCEIEKFSVSVPNVDVKIDKDKAVVELYVAPDLLELLSDVTPTGELSIGATVVPAFSVKQDFTKEVTYLVTAEDGKTQKTWTVKPVVSKYVAQGIGSVDLLWAKDVTKLGITNAEPTIASFEDKVIVSRPGKIFDGATGEYTGQDLNVEGMQGSATPANNIPFVLANDSEGNLIGCTLGAWVAAGEGWRVYKWNSLAAAPVEVLSYVQKTSDGAKESFGRKLTVVGDINANAIITSYNIHDDNIKLPTIASAAGYHYCWSVAGGVANTTPERVAVPVYRSGDMYQLIYPESATAAKPFYFSDRGSSSAQPLTTVGYVPMDGDYVAIKGKVPESDNIGGADEMFKQTGFGRQVLHICPFTFNGVKYMAVSSYYSTYTPDKTYVYTSLLEIKGKDYTVVRTLRDVFDIPATANGNGTSGLAVSKVETDEDGEMTCRIYHLMSGIGMVAYDISNVKE